MALAGHEGKLQGQFVEKTRNNAHLFSGKWIRNGFLKKETEVMLYVAQEQALRTNSIKAKIEKQPVSSKCRLCGTKKETVMHLVRGCPKLDTVNRNSTKEDITMLPEEFIGNYARSHGLDISDTDRWYEHTPADVMENDEVELYWDLTIQTDMAVAHNRPDIMLKKQCGNGQSLILVFQVTSM